MENMDTWTEGLPRLVDHAMGVKEAVELPMATVDHSSTNLLDCWERIYDCLKEPTDKMSLLNAMPALVQHIKTKKTELLLRRTLQILMKQENIDPEIIVKCREINSSTLEIVDKTLQETQPWWLFYWYEFDSATRIHEFMDYASKLPAKTIPFLANSCSIRASNRNCLRAATAMFSALGTPLSHVRVNFDYRITPRSMYRMVNRVLRETPNVQNLDILGRLRLNEGQLERRLNLIRGTLPALPKLKCLSLRLYDGLPHHAPIFTQMLATYGPQASMFRCNKFAFLAGIPGATFTNLLGNLQHLQVGILDMSSAPVFRELATIQLPALKTLELRRDYHVDDAEDVIFSEETVQAIHNFSLSLEHLVLDSVNELYLRRIDPSMLEVIFPKLKKLTVCTSNVNWLLSMWPLFQANFPHLEEISCVTRSGHSRIPIPINATLRPFFDNFTSLNKITWEHEETPLEPINVCSRFDVIDGGE